MTTLLTAIKNYATNHNGQYPGSFGQLTASGDLGASTFAGNLGLDDFELMKDGAVDPNGNKVILSLRVPLQRPGGASVIVLGGIGDDGVTQTLHKECKSCPRPGFTSAPSIISSALR